MIYQYRKKIENIIKNRSKIVDTRLLRLLKKFKR